MDINKSFSMAALCAVLSACAPAPHREAPALSQRAASAPALCGKPDAGAEMDYYQSTRQAYLDAGMDDELSTYLAHTASAMMSCIWHQEFGQFAGRTCSVKLDFSGTRPEKSFSGDKALCAFIEKQIVPVAISPPPASYLKQHQAIWIEFTPG
ncbi:hypothetical protein [Sodalis sp. C49]|uniref:hypothetical protein n=1 Tax=unclassified Sodalis (in: enterobacteria) TaxID=2636512 RepID=UPI003965C05C